MKKFFLVMVAALMLLPSCKEQKCCKCCCEPGSKEIGIQLYSIRELIGKPELWEANQATVLKTIADYGYTAVEAANYKDGLFYGQTPEKYKADVEAAGLKSLSSHTSHALSAEELASGDFSASLEWWKEAIPAHVAAGMNYIVVPSFPIPDNLKDLKTYCDYFSAVGKLCAEAGVAFGYHNHSREFMKVEDTVVYDYMIENTDPSCVFFEMDVYWAVMGQAAPVEYFKKYPGRFTLLHIKDFREVGQSGMVGFDAIYKNFKASGMKAFVVEMEGSSYNDILKTCQESADYLLKAPFVKASYCCCEDECCEKDCCKACDKKDCCEK